MGREYHYREELPISIWPVFRIWIKFLFALCADFSDYNFFLISFSDLTQQLRQVRMTTLVFLISYSGLIIQVLVQIVSKMIRFIILAMV